MKRFFILLSLYAVLSGCGHRNQETAVSSCRFAEYFDISDDGKVVLFSPYDDRHDTLYIYKPFDNLVCMSSTHVAGLSAIGADSVITAVSGLDYICAGRLKEAGVFDVGYESSMDFERIVSLHPDAVLAYTVSGAEPQYITKLRSLGIPVLVLYDHLESHPLARAEYIRLYGALTGRQHVADSIFSCVCERYLAIAETSRTHSTGVKVLMNIPYGDLWYVPGGNSYMARLVQDAGGEVLGAKKGQSASRVISLEYAWSLSREADIWLNPGYCSTRRQLESVHQLFPFFGPLADGLPVYNNTLRMSPEGGNDFFETGSVRPDLILADLTAIFDGTYSQENGNFFIRLD
ncbi:MAG: ABC transporter substrate-binding protein [Bacteroidales bacterium]|nr:ABC transporter substrate-binding protein [Bacteroidales bacterium]